MKGIDIFCASQASTAIRLSMEEPSSSSSNTLLLSNSPAIDRYNPIIRDSSRTASKPISPPTKTTSQPPTKPHNNHKNHHNKKKNNTKSTPPKENDDRPTKGDTISTTIIKPDGGDDEKIKISGRSSIGRKSWSCIKPPGDFTTIKADDENEKIKISSHNSIGRKSWSCTRPGDVISPPGSTRYLLREKVVFNSLSDLDPTLKLFPNEIPTKAKALKTNELSCDAKEHSLPEQVVVLRVSLHCRGCEKKMRKHLSRMEGITSFNIEFMAKKVTVKGSITPLDVLSSISKVKNAQLWPPTISSATVNLSNSSEFKTDQ